jgi:virginiamycin B lyase
MVEYKTPSGGGGPHTLIITDDQSTIWFTMQSGNKLASLDTTTGQSRSIASSGGPYGLSLDKAGNVWFCRMGDNKMGKLDPKTGQMSEVDMGPRSAAAPRRDRARRYPVGGALRQRQARQARSGRDEGREGSTRCRRVTPVRTR